MTLSLDGVLYLKIIDAYSASYGVEDPGEFCDFYLRRTDDKSPQTSLHKQNSL